MKDKMEIIALNREVKELRDKLNTNNAEWIDRCRRFRKQDSDKADAVINRLHAAASNLLAKHKLGTVSEADVAWMETELENVEVKNG